MVHLPANGDTVLLILPESDPSHAVVLGGLYGPSRPPDACVEGSKRARVRLQTPAHEGLLLDDDARKIRLKDSASNSMEFSRDGIVLHAEGDLTIRAPGRRIRIVAGQIDFDRG
jgi:hypothetical protein